MEVRLQFAKLAMNVPNVHCYKLIYIAGGNFCCYYWRSLRPFFDWNATTTKLLGNPQKGFALRQQIRESPLVL